MERLLELWPFFIWILIPLARWLLGRRDERALREELEEEEEDWFDEAEAAEPLDQLGEPLRSEPQAEPLAYEHDPPLPQPEPPVAGDIGPHVPETHRYELTPELPGGTSHEPTAARPEASRDEVTPQPPARGTGARPSAPSPVAVPAVTPPRSPYAVAAAPHLNSDHWRIRTRHRSRLATDVRATLGDRRALVQAIALGAALAPRDRKRINPR